MKKNNNLLMQELVKREQLEPMDMGMHRDIEVLFLHLKDKDFTTLVRRVPEHFPGQEIV